MADIQMCVDDKCPSNTICHRFTAPVNKHLQSYGDQGRPSGKDRCDNFMPNEGRIKQFKNEDKN